MAALHRKVQANSKTGCIQDQADQLGFAELDRLVQSPEYPLVSSNQSTTSAKRTIRMKVHAIVLQT
jgi:hypothetical protein